jgi:hypothetical protein
MPDEVARIGALSNGSNGQRSLESASLHFEPICKRERGASRVGACRRNPEPKAKDLVIGNLKAILGKKQIPYWLASQFL